MLVPCRVSNLSGLGPSEQSEGTGILDKNVFREEHAAVCDEDQPYCVDELQVDWFGRGQQLSTIIRGCRKNPPPETCAEGANSSFKVWVETKVM